MQRDCRVQLQLIEEKPDAESDEKLYVMILVKTVEMSSSESREDEDDLLVDSGAAVHVWALDSLPATSRWLEGPALGMCGAGEISEHR